MTTLELVPLTEDTDTEDGLTHWYCEDCYPEGDRAFCGKRLTAGPTEEEAEDVECPTCMVIDTCPKCDW